MIFVTVGTHEQSFKRLIEKIDELVEKKIISEDVFMQIGYTNDYKPKHCKFKEMLTVEEMNEYSKNARIIITHGGPGTIMLPFELGKVPIVVPRNPIYDEHVDEHQILFTKKLVSVNKVIGVFDIEELEKKILDYDKYVGECKKSTSNSHNKFVELFENEIEELMNNKRG